MKYIAIQTLKDYGKELRFLSEKQMAEVYDRMPGIEIPETHGRLIDADTLWMDVIHAMDYCDDILEMIEQQPTVMEEE